MKKLKERITENGIDYILAGDYYIPDLKLPEENRPIGRYGRLHREYLKQEHPARYSSLILTGTLWTYLADLNEQAEVRLDLIIEQMKAAEEVTEELKAQNQLEQGNCLEQAGILHRGQNHREMPARAAYDYEG